MSILRKSSKKTSARKQIDIRGVQDSILLLRRNEYRVVLEVSSLNFELKSEDEQDVLIDTYESFLNSLPCQVQILVRIRELDMSKYITDLKGRLKNETEDIYKEQLSNYSEFVGELVADNRILSRRFYIVIPYGAKNNDFATAKEQLAIHADIVSKGLLRMGMHSRRLGDLELLNLFYEFYNPTQAKLQPIRDSVLTLISSSFVKGERS
ncbi:MAG: TraC family protein [Anaerolineae bacterium]|nr:TraC family protein [Anaerolineae bacterium]